MTSTQPAPRVGLIIGALMLVLLLATLDQTIVSTALPTIVGELGGLAELSWVVTAYLLSSTVVGPIYGKLGDLYGRKIVLQAAIGIFLVGSALCGLSRTMPELIAARALQGLGGGGLIVTTLAAIGDVIAPAERGRYQGYFGAVFGVATVAGPLLGGFFVEHLTWRWIFTVNLPLGFVALVVLGAAFRTRPERRAHDIDYGGAVLIASLLSCAVLVTTLAGTRFSWGSPLILGLLAAVAVLAASFVFVERVVPEPILPPALFRNPIFSVCIGLGFGIGLALFGSVTFLPLYLQIVGGLGASDAGMRMLPLVAGMVITSTACGRLISRFGRYRPFPIAGTGLMTLGLALLATLSPTQPIALMSGYMLIVGIGMGLAMPVLVLAVQNGVAREHLGVATSGVALFRSIGGSAGVSVFGAIFAQGLGTALSRAVPPGSIPANADPVSIRALPAPIHAAYIDAFAAALQPVFVIAAAVGAATFVLAWLLKDKPLRRTAGGQAA
jgi:EmrB/QacA subfamily drug resistance transporter